MNLEDMQFPDTEMNEAVRQSGRVAVAHAIYEAGAESASSIVAAIITLGQMYLHSAYIRAQQSRGDAAERYARMAWELGSIVTHVAQHMNHDAVEQMFADDDFVQMMGSDLDAVLHSILNPNEKEE